MKKLMSLVLALAMILSLAACGGKTTGTSPDRRRRFPAGNSRDFGRRFP